MHPSANSVSDTRKFGTFGGVFTPCTLTILGVIMFLRFGQVVGQAGVFYALGIVLLAKLITTLTAFSLSAIATNTRVQGGGAYFLISRSLGVEFGGVIGIFFFIAQAISVAMYVIGFTEAFLAAFPQLGLSMRVTATLVHAVVFICVYIGAGWTIKLQYGILAILLASLVSFVLGAFDSLSAATLAHNLRPSFLAGENLFTMFALFFPAVTGIMAGANMSGDLREPARSIPLGTLGAIVFTGIIYLGLALVLGGSRTQGELIANNLIMKDMAWSPGLINAGIFAATLSSALGSMMGAPRILQAFARDDVMPQIKGFARGSGATNEPRRATVLTFVIAQAAVLLGDLNAIAPIITMFFMITYSTLNLACFYEAMTNNPSYRPTFRCSHWLAALLGAVGCVAVMILIAPLWAVMSLLAMAALHQWISRKEIQTRWGDVISGAAYERARRALLTLEDERYHPKNWRPAILALSGGAWNRYHLAEYGYWLTAGRGILSLGQVIGGDVEDRLARRLGAERALRRFIQDEELAAFPAVVVEENLLEGLKALLQCHGIGGLRPNTVLLGWSTDPERLESFGATLRLVRDMQRSIIAIWCNEDKPRWLAPAGPVDVWWRGQKHGALMLILAHLLVQNPEWRHRPLRVLYAMPEKGDRDQAAEHLDKLIALARIQASPEIVLTNDMASEIKRRSSQAAVVFLGFDPPEKGEELDVVTQTTHLINGLENVILVSNAGDVSLEA